MLATSLVARLFDGPLDILGDIHGEIDALSDLLRHLGYRADGEHPDGRRLVFIGDLTDRGPNSPAVAAYVGYLVGRGLAQCVMGNHELNLLRQARKEGNGWFFADDHDRRDGRFSAAKELPAEQRPALQSFLRCLPLALFRSDLRLVHAAWDSPSIAKICASHLTALELYEMYDEAAAERALETGLKTRARAEHAAYRAHVHDRGFAMPLLPSVAALEEFSQVSNPVRIVTSGIEKVAAKAFFASGKWRMTDRIPWWDEYDETTPVIMGHYWRWPTTAARDSYSRGDPDLFASHAPNHWIGRRRNVFCVDFAVGARYKERSSDWVPPFECRLAAVRWPERELAFDDGRTMALE